MANRWQVMSEYCREQHPLLCEEGSEDQPLSPRYHRRVRPTYRGRARYNLRGAAAILARWPDHWSSFLTFWWIGIGMISLMTFVIYNSLFAFSILPTANMKLVSFISENETSHRSSMLPNIYMHLFVSPNEEIDANQYIPYIEILANTFSDFKFSFIVVINDTNVGWMSAEENNELALNTLWKKDKTPIERISKHGNVIIERVTLSAYMDHSPLKKYWRMLPQQLIEFLARTVAIWDFGGVAFNPDILTPRFKHTLYIDKLQKLLNEYGNTNKIINNARFTNKLSKTQNKNKKLNNIRDIIDALENEDMPASAFSQQTLAEAENRDIQFTRHAREISTVTESTAVNGSADSKGDVDETRSEAYIHNIDSAKQSESNAALNETEATYQADYNTTKMSLLPLFLEFLFHNKVDGQPKATEITHISKTQRSTTETLDSDNNNSSQVFLKQPEPETEDIYRPIIVPAPEVYNKSYLDRVFSVPQKEKRLEPNKLTIDLKGNIIATDTPCHAFLGTIYSNVIHHSEEEAVTDFIIAELTIFCKGLLSSCMGIEVILL